MKTKKQVESSKPKKNEKTGVWLSPSQWGVWRKCALSVSGSSSTLKVEADDYANEGTDLHKDIADILTGARVEYGDREDAAIVRFAVETTKNILAAGGAMKVEHFMKQKISNYTIGGTADCLIADGDTIIVIDHKTGWKEVEAENNEQLKIYAHLAAKEYKFFTKWQGVIINARFNSTSYTSGDIDPNYLKSIAKDVDDRLKKKQFATGYHCAYCPRLTTCKHIRKAIHDWMIPGAIDGLTREPDKLAEALKLEKPAVKLFETIRKEAQMYIDLGGKLPGVSIEYSPGNRAFPSDLPIMQIASRLRMSAVMLTETKLITPAEALRRGADKDAIESIVIRPPRKGFKFN